jgi:hypothetical protein
LIVYECIFLYGPEEEISVRFTEDVPYNEICEMITREHGEFGKVKFLFANKPWDDVDEITQYINNINNVKNCRYISPLTGKYSPPKIIFKYEGDITPIKTRILEYYRGIDVKEVSSNRGEVILSASID